MFYPAVGNRDGRSNQCKDCTKKATDQNRRNNIRRVREYFRSYRKTDNWKKCRMRSDENYSARNPEKRLAKAILNNAKRDGKISSPDACETCMKIGPVHAHHDDYSKPTAVKWLCRCCHRKLHGLEGNHEDH
jgi:hypothetical protein